MKTLVIVLGMYRSGASAITRSLELLGVRQGAGAPTSNGVHSVWADPGCGEINERLLNLIGVHHPFDLAWDSLRPHAGLDALKREAIDLVSGRMGENGGAWGFADPRACRVLPFWTEVVSNLEVEPSFVIAARHPASVARSLAVGFGVAREKAYLLWLQHVLAALIDTPSSRRIVVDYDDLMADPYSQLVRLSDKMRWPAPDPGDVDPSSLIRGRSHCGSGCTAQPRDMRLMPLVADVHRVQRLLATDQQPEDGPGIHETLAVLRDKFNDLMPVFSYIKSLEMRSDEIMAEREDEVTSLERALRDSHRQLVDLSARLARHDQDIAALQESTSWRVTKPLRLASRLLKRGDNTSQVDRSNSPAPVSPNGRRGRSVDADEIRLPKGFDRDTYLTLNPDVAASGMDPVTHYVNYGCHEARLYSLSDEVMRGAHRHRGDLESVLVVSHEASRTGAPVLSLNLVQALVGRYNVVVLLLGGGPLADAFFQAGAVTLSASSLKGNALLAYPVVDRLHDRFNFKFALVNSIESRAVLPALARRFIPAVSLVHEFAAYTRPRDAFTGAVFWSSEIVFSANLTLESAQREIPDMDAMNAHVLPQGRCEVPGLPEQSDRLEDEKARVRRVVRPSDAADDLVVVLGAGSVQLRKGVELFIESAARVVSSSRTNCRFVWFGHGYNPDLDSGYSAYLADQIRRAGLEKNVVFADETPAFGVAYEEADLFLLSSRLDPLPNVAIDALTHGLPVLCFEKASGIAEFLQESGLGQSCVARYLDSADMAEKIENLAASKSLRREVGAQGRDLALSFFDMERYVGRVTELAQRAVGQARQEKRDMDLIVSSGLFREDFSVPPNVPRPALERAVRLHVRSWASGIGRRKPFPGFHPGVYLEQHGLATGSVDPTADYIRAGRPEGPWTYPVISGENAIRALPIDRTIALHIHVYYPELLPEITSRLLCNRVRPDLFVSVANEEARRQVQNELNAYPGTVVAVDRVPNRGRDIGPLLTAFGPAILPKYEYVGHLHTKKSADIKDAAFGKAWYEFLLEHLLGNSSLAMADAILSTMRDDRSIGMMFPDDPNVLGWTANRALAEPLAARLGLGTLPSSFNFPIGTMLWARTAALAPFINLNLQWDDYPLEPVPYDGSLLHAIERLLPLTLSLVGLQAGATNVSGVSRAGTFSAIN